jgi:hypothetical protein
MTEGYRKKKTTIYKWRENHREAFVKYTNEYNSKHREEINRKTLLNYHYKKQCRIFRNILLPDENL